MSELESVLAPERDDAGHSIGVKKSNRSLISNLLVARESHVDVLLGLHDRKVLVFKLVDHNPGRARGLLHLLPDTHFVL